MVKVVTSFTTRYKNITYKPYTEFLIDDSDKAEFVRLGATIVEEKALNPNKKVETKAETKVETKEVKEDKKSFFKKDEE